MAVPIGTGEYVVMLAAFALLGLALIIYFLQKWIREKFVISVFELFALSVIKFLLVRVGLLSFLLYLRWGLLPQILAAGTGSQKEYLLKVGDYLAVTWEMLYIFSISILCTIVSLMFYKWRTISSGDFKIPLGWIIGANVAVYVVSIVLIVIQYVYARDPDSTWEHVGYIWNAALLFIFAIVAHIQADSIHTSVGRREVKNEETFELRKNAYIVKIASTINTICLIVRAVAIAVDAFSFKFIPKGTGAQVLWNVFFKYVLWIAPEVISIIAMVIAMNFTEQLMYNLAKIETKYKGGAEELDEVGQDEYKRVVGDDVEEETMEHFMQRTGETAINENETASSSSHFVQVQ